MKLDELKRLAEAATPGPWEMEEPADDEAPCYCVVSKASDGGTFAMFYCYEREQDKANSVYFSALSPERVLAMLKVIEAAKEMRGANAAKWIDEAKLTCFDAALSALEIDT